MSLPWMIVSAPYCLHRDTWFVYTVPVMIIPVMYMLSVVTEIKILLNVTPVHILMTGTTMWKHRALLVGSGHETRHRRGGVSQQTNELEAQGLEFQTFTKRKTYHLWFKMEIVCAKCVVLVRGPPPPSHLGCHLFNKMDQAFPPLFCILQAIKNWTVGRHGNEANHELYIICYLLSLP